MKQSVEKVLITINEGIQFMGQGKNHMKVRGVDDFRPAFIHPDFLLYSLTVRAVTVAAGVVVDFYVPTVRTLTEVTAKLSGLAA